MMDFFNIAMFRNNDVSESVKEALYKNKSLKALLAEQAACVSNAR